MTVTTKPLFASKTFNYVDIQFAARKDEAVARLSYQRYHQTILATQQGRMQSIIRCSIPLHESIYLLFLPQISLHTYHMLNGPIGQRQVGVLGIQSTLCWDLITHPCPRCLLLAILHVPDKQLPKLVARRNRSHHGSLLVSTTTVVFANTRHTSICWEFRRRPLCVGYVMPFKSNRLPPRLLPFGSRRVITLTAPGARKP